MYVYARIGLYAYFMYYVLLLSLVGKVKNCQWSIPPSSHYFEVGGGEVVDSRNSSYGYRHQRLGYYVSREMMMLRLLL
jgi:hypothetical protein